MLMGYMRDFLSGDECAPIKDLLTRFMVKRLGLDPPDPDLQDWQKTEEEEMASGSDGRGRVPRSLKSEPKTFKIIKKEKGSR